MMKRFTLVLALLSALPLLGAPASPIRAKASEKAFPFPVEEKVLANGLHLYAVHYNSPGLIAYYSVVRTGARNEVEPGHTGFAHFFEHMMFRGTEKYPAEKYDAVVKSLGADSNASTWDDKTVYHTLAGKESLATIAEIEADRFQHLKYDKPAFQKESRAVLGEYNKNASNPFAPLNEKLLDLAFTTHTYKHSAIGFLKDIEDMPNQYDYSLQFFDRYYRPENVQILVVGDVDAKEFFRLAEKFYGGWKKGPGQPPVSSEPPQTEEKRGTVEWKSATLPIIFMGYHVPAYSTETLDGPALDVLSELLFADRAPLHKRLVLEEQKVDAFGGGADAHRDPHLFEIFARVKQEKDVPNVEREIEDEIEKIAATPPDVRTVTETVAHLRYAFAGELSTADRVASQASAYVAIAGNLQTINDYYALFDRVTPGEVSRVARQYFGKANRTVVALQPPAPKGESK
jgi:zinc protease